MCAEVEKLKRSMAVRRPVVGVLVEAAAAGEDDERDLGVAEHRELVRLLEEAVAALAEGDLPVRGVLDALDLDLAPPLLVAGARRRRQLLCHLRRPAAQISLKKNRKRIKREGNTIKKCKKFQFPKREEGDRVARRRMHNLRVFRSTTIPS